MEIRTFGVGRRLSVCESILAERLYDRGGRLFLLPIPTSRDNRYITASHITVDGLCREIYPTDYLVGYDLPPTLCDFADREGIFYYDAARDEDFLLANAVLTARGTVGYILTELDRDIADMTFGIVGYGRIGGALLRLLLFFGAPTTVFTGRESLAIELCRSGISSRLVGEGCNAEGIDILINTAPSRQLREEDIPDETKIIDLASGNIFEPSDRLVRLPSVPERYYPVTAGRLYAEAILRGLWGERL